MVRSCFSTVDLDHRDETVLLIYSRSLYGDLPLPEPFKALTVDVVVVRLDVLLYSASTPVTTRASVFCPVALVSIRQCAI